MKNDNNSGLCIKQIMAAVITIIVINFGANLITHSKTNFEMANIAPKENVTLANVKEETQILKTSYLGERKIALSTRSATERTKSTVEEQIIEEQEESIEEKPNYISIDEITISKDMDLTKKCGISKNDFKTLMSNLQVDTSGFFKENSDIIYDLCEKYELNEIFFCGLIAGESGWNIASNHRKTNNYISMMSGGKLIRYSTVEEGLEAAAKLLHKNYLTEGGSFYYGKTLSCVQKKFCPNSSTWVGLIYRCMSQIVK